MKKLIFVALLLLVPVSALAQDSFKQVWVNQADSGEVLHGRLLDLSHGSMVLLTKDNRRLEIPLDRVLRIETRGDSLRNGAAIGAGVMATLVLLTCRGFGGGGECVTAALVEGGIGAVMGAGIDALNGGRTAIYTRQAAMPAGKTARVGFTVKF